MQFKQFFLHGHGAFFTICLLSVSSRWLRVLSTCDQKHTRGGNAGKIIVVVSLWVERYEANMQHVRYEKDTVVLYFGDTDISFGGRSFD